MMSNSSQVIQLDQLSAQDEFPAYVAIYAEQLSGNPFVLSPTVMRWSEQVLICRVNDCEQFWLAQQQKSACDLSNYLRGYSFIISATGISQYLQITPGSVWFTWLIKPTSNRRGFIFCKAA